MIDISKVKVLGTCDIVQFICEDAVFVGSQHEECKFHECERKRQEKIFRRAIDFHPMQQKANFISLLNLRHRRIAAP